MAPEDRPRDDEEIDREEYEAWERARDSMEETPVHPDDFPSRDSVTNPS